LGHFKHHRPLAIPDLALVPTGLVAKEIF
jgi:hypothetical protein